MYLFGEPDIPTPDGDVWEGSAPILKKARIPIPSNPLFPELLFKPRPILVSYPKQGNYAPPTRHQKMLQMSMKFIPLAVNEPKAKDSPYLFKVPGKTVSYATPQRKRPSKPAKSVDSKMGNGQEKKEVVGQACLPRPIPTPPPPKVPVTPSWHNMTLGLGFPQNPTYLQTRAHQNFFMTYIDHTNKLLEAEHYTDEPDPEKPLSISCAHCCKLPKRPKSLEKEVDEDEGDGNRKWIPPPDYFGPLAFFPDSLYQNGDRPGSAEIDGWMDSNGVFHEATMGDFLPTNAVLGSRGKSGVFHFLTPVREGVQSGALGVRMANTDLIGPFLGDPSTAFLRSVEAGTSGQFKLDEDEDYPWLKYFPDGVVGFVVDPEYFNFHPLQSGEIIPVGGRPVFQTPPRKSVAVTASGQIKTDDKTQSPKDAGKSLKDGQGNVVPAEAFKWYVDENGVFHPYTPGDVIPPGGFLAHQTADRKVIQLESTDQQGQLEKGKKKSADDQAVFEGFGGSSDVVQPTDSGDVIPPVEGSAQPTDAEKVNTRSGGLGQIPPESVAGYVDANQKFHTLDDGVPLKAGSIFAHRTADGTITLMDKSHTTWRESLTDELWGELPEGAVRGYNDENGQFHPLMPGEKIPPGGTPSYQLVSGKVVPVELSDRARSEWAGTGHDGKQGDDIKQGHEVKHTQGIKGPKDASRQTTTGDGEPTDTDSIMNELDSYLKKGGKLGYVDQEGRFFELEPGNPLPEGGILAFIGSDGKVHTIPSDTELGYVNSDGEFVPLRPGESPPPGAHAVGYRGKSGTFQPVHGAGQPTTADGEPTDTDSIRNEVDMYLKRDSKLGYVDQDGNFVELDSEKSMPEGGIVAFIGSDGKVHTIPPDTELGYIDKNGEFVPIRPGESPPPDAHAIGYRKSGTFRPVHASSVQQYRDNEGVVHEVVPGEAIPEGAVIMRGVAGYLDKKTLEFSVLKPGESLPEGTLLIYRPEEGAGGSGIPGSTGIAYMDENGIQVGVIGGYIDELTGEFHELKPMEKIPSGGRAAYQSADGRVSLVVDLGNVHRSVHNLKKGEKAPKGSRMGWVRPDGVFIPFDEAGEDSDLRNGVELTDEERAALEALTKSLGIQVDLERIEGSLDLGDVFRKSFRIYSHGGSVDIDTKPEPPHSTLPPKVADQKEAK